MRFTSARKSTRKSKNTLKSKKSFQFTINWRGLDRQQHNDHAERDILVLERLHNMVESSFDPLSGGFGLQVVEDRVCTGHTHTELLARL